MSTIQESSPVEYEYEKLDPIPVVYGYLGVAASALFFFFVNLVLVRIGNPKSVKEADEWKYRNLLVSWIHAVLIGVWDLSCFFLFPELMTDLIAFHNLYIYFMVTFSTGYFVYDFIDLIVNEQALKQWELIPHHISVAGTFFFNVVQTRCLAFNVIALLAEVNSIFLHGRKLLQLAHVPYNQPIYRFNSALNLFTFVSCRFLCLTWIVYGMWMWYARVSLVYLAVLGATMFILWVTNAILFWRLLCSDLLRGRGRKRRLSDAQPNGFSHSSKPVSNGIETNGSCNGHHNGNHVEPLCVKRGVDADNNFHRNSVHSVGEGVPNSHLD